jgi:alpha-1,2-mannosyltransferase
MAAHWLTRARLQLYGAAFALFYLAIGVQSCWQYPHGVDRQGIPAAQDFLVFWGASSLARGGNAAAAYDSQALAAAQRQAVPAATQLDTWYYPPTFLLAVLPLSLLPWLWSYLLAMAATFAGYAAVLRRIVLEQGLPAAGLWGPLLGFPPLFFNLYQGQNGFLTAALAGGALLLLRRQALAAGVLIGLLTIKPQLGPLLPLALVCGRHWRALLSAAVTALLFAAISQAVLGGGAMHAFLHTVPQVGQAIAGNPRLVGEMPSVYAFWRLLGLPAAAAYALHGVVALAVAAAVGWIWWKCRDAALCAAALTAGTLLISPYLFDYDLCWLGLALAWFGAKAQRDGWRRGEREVMVLAWLLPFLWMPLHHYTGLQLGALSLLALFVLIVRRALAEVRTAGVVAA